MTTYEEFNILEIRARLGLSREAMAKMLGWTGSRLWALEKRGDPLTMQEYAHASGVLAERLGEHESIEADTLKARDRYLRDTPAGTVRLVDWNGVSHGDVVRIRRMEGTYTFLYHQVGLDGSNEHVTVYGGTKGHGAIRSVTPDRVIGKRRS